MTPLDWSSAKALSDLVTELPNWRLLPGCLLRHVDHDDLSGRVMDALKNGEYLQHWTGRGLPGQYLETKYPDHAWVDFRDAATVGCLEDLVLSFNPRLWLKKVCAMGVDMSGKDRSYYTLMEKHGSLFGSPYQNKAEAWAAALEMFQ